MSGATAIVAGCLCVAASQGPAPPRSLRLSPDSTALAPPCEVPPATGGPHAYFDALVRRPEHYCNWSLRSQQQLNSLVADSVSTHFTYSPSTDSYPDKQDAAKFVRSEGGSSSIPTTQQLRFNLRKIQSGTALLTWDWYWGREFRENRGAVNFYKMFQMIIDGHGWWTLMTGLTWASDSDTREIGKAWDSFRSGTLADGVVQREPWHPAGLGAVDQRRGSPTQYPQHHSVWSRYWIEIRLLQPPTEFTEWSVAHLGGRPLSPNPDDAEGRWHMVSLWMADENRSPQRLLYRVPVNWNAGLGWEPHLSMFKFEMNTSQPALSLTGPLIGYGRNVVILHNYRLPAVAESDTTLFQKPVG